MEYMPSDRSVKRWQEEQERRKREEEVYQSRRRQGIASAEEIRRHNVQESWETIRFGIGLLATLTFIVAIVCGILARG